MELLVKYASPKLTRQTKTREDRGLNMRLPATVGLIFAMILLWIIGALFSAKDEPAGIFALSVGDVIVEHIRPWLYLTSGFYHPHFFQLVFVLPVTFALAKRVEPELGSLNFVRLLVMVNTLSTFLLFVEMFSLYIIFRNPIYLKSSLSGFTGGLTALLVAYMKQSPYATASFLPGLKLRFYPLAATAFFTFCSLIAMSSSSTVLRVVFLGAGPYSFFGGYFGWYYLRFLNRNADQSVGDLSEDFALDVMLPDACGPFVTPVTTFCFNVVKLCGYFKNRSAKAPSTLPVVMDKSDDPIAERRKARAMKALDEKLAKLASTAPPRSNNGLSQLSTIGPDSM
ncbi:hypothetical protein Poli38472_000236 [Pythium oligandrum]|uniref:Uncharacterized protein n=1 Tax=Pythium oligandrum TaxID=41045 RepID=A0A8K1FGN4_PYTOL|nr:hypothetical protein Poli38472_000236 [Pythium oligandrum]|eukprot:TMW60194.1 hypothetical protein Poli38472_000236 [Pythium oligandrum]